MYSSRSPTDLREDVEGHWGMAGHDRIQQLGTRPSYAMRQSPHHQRSMTEEMRRPALTTQFRSRSNTSTSTSNDMLVGSIVTSPGSSLPRSSPRTSVSVDRSSSSFSTHSRVERSESLGKSLMKKGSKFLRRKGSASELTSLRLLDWSDELKEGETNSRMKREPPMPGHSRMLSEDYEPKTRPSISEPFNFQHLTHTEPVQFQKMQQAHHNDFISEFSAMRASQAPQRQLRGIRAEDIQRNNLCHGTYSPETSSRPQTADAASPNNMRSQSFSDSSVYNAFSPIVNLNHSEILETCAQMSASHLADSYDVSPMTTPPPRSSSRFSPSLVSNSFAHHREAATNIRSKYPTFDEDHMNKIERAEPRQPFDYAMATWNDGIYDFAIPHAMTTPDDAAFMLRPPPFQMMKTELEKVLEEDECSEGKRSSIATLTARPTTPNPTLRHTKSFPSISSSNQRSPESKPLVPIIERGSPNKKKRVSSQVFPLIERDYDELPVRPRVARHPSADTDFGGDANWEDLVDWCYDQSAEADCDFDFTRASIPVEATATPSSAMSAYNGAYVPPLSPLAEGPDLVDEQHAPKRPTSSIYSSHRPVSSAYSAPQSPTNNQVVVPELEPTSTCSAQSSFDSGSEAVTPCLEASSDLSSSYHMINSKTGYSDLSGPASIVIPNDVGLSEMDDDLYHEHFGAESMPSAPFPYNIGHVEGSTVSSISARSSRSPISKSSSQESFWTRHRASNSAGSLPDLIPSKSRSDNVNSVVLEQLAEQISALTATDSASNNSQPTNGHRRRSSTLAKDVAVKSMLSRVTQPALESGEVRLCNMDIHPAFRDRAGTEAAFRTSQTQPSTATNALSRPVVSKRLRSASSASSLKSPSRPASRASYGLFPKTGVRTSAIEPTFPGR